MELTGGRCSLKLPNGVAELAVGELVEDIKIGVLYRALDCEAMSPYFRLCLQFFCEARKIKKKK